MNDYMSFDDYLKFNNGYDANFDVHETTKVLNSNQYRGGVLSGSGIREILCRPENSL